MLLDVFVVMWLAGYVAVWLCGYVAFRRCGYEPIVHQPGSLPFSFKVPSNLKLQPWLSQGTLDVIAISGHVLLISNKRS